ncbi:MAG: hypothetical protein HS117_19480 [Verrucomicrobiaceae bacterium]|nr:hypothetical protein [Verrucomicrobiaceae bacterium]
MSKRLVWLPPQLEVLKRCDSTGMMYVETRRQFGKTTLFSGIALKKMMKFKGRLVTFASASLNVGKELIYKQDSIVSGAVQMLRENLRDTVKKEAAVFHATLDDFTAEAAAAGMRFNLAERDGKDYKQIDVDGIADLFERSRLEMRLWHSTGVCSRTQIIAPNPATARGFTGDVLIDEIGFIPDFAELWEAMEPIASRDPTFRLVMASTPPPDEGHLCFKIGQPPKGMTFEPNANGHWYRSAAGVLCLRVDVWDAEKCGVKLYDLETRQPITPEQHRALSFDKDAWDRNYALKRIPGGLVAMPSTAIDAAQAKGAEDCLAFDLGTIEEGQEEATLARVVGAVQNIAGAGSWGAGYDIATTTNAKSNPSSLTLTQAKGAERRARLIVRWKSANPEFSKSLVIRACETLKHAGGTLRAVGIDGSNERYFASQMKAALEAAGFSVQIVVSGETQEDPDNPKAKMRMKEKLGGLLVNTATDRLLALPPDKWVKDDFLLQKKEKGLFVCDLDAAGNHGDTFDSTKLSVFALEVEGQPDVFEMPIGSFSQPTARDPNPSWLRRTVDAFTSTFYG